MRQKFSKLTIRSSLIAVIGILTVSLSALGALGLYSLRSSNSDLQSLYADRLVAMQQLSQVMVALDLGRSGIAAAILDPANVDSELAKMEHAIQDGDLAWKRYNGTAMSEREKALAASFTSAYQKLLQDGVRPATEAVRGFNIPGATELYSQNLLPLYLQAHVPMTQLIQLQNEIGQQVYAQSQQRYRVIMGVSVIAMIFGVVFALSMGILLIRSISRPLGNAVRIAQSVAASDLTLPIEINSDNETGQLLHALKRMKDSLQGIVGQVRASTETITTAATEIASGNQDLSGRTEQQAAALEETASSMEQLTSTVLQNAEHAHQARQLVESTSSVAEQGGQAVRQMVQIMGEIHADSRQIVDIISVIDGIAFQTNILALNAAVEAARAGEQGRGFAVVASEVRALAQRSAVAAKEIKSLIGTSVGKIDNGSTLAQQTGEMMHDVVHSVQRVTEIVGTIADASAEQSRGIKQVNLALTQMDESSQRNAALVEQAAAAAQSLMEQAVQLRGLVQVFKLSDTAANPTVLPVRAATQRLPHDTPTRHEIGYNRRPSPR